MEDYVNSNGLQEGAYDIYIAEDSGSSSKAAKVSEAVDDGATVIILGGFSWDNAVVKIVKKYPNVCFLSFELTAKSYPSNMINITFAEEISGFLAGYAIVMDGYSQLGFLGGAGSNAGVVRYGYGFIQGANYAANELNTPVTMKYWYSGSYWPTDEIKARMEKWYRDGTEVVFSCGGNIIESCIEAADENYGSVIGVDQDQASLSNTVITSACKLYDQATLYVLNLYNARLNRWPSYMVGLNVRLSIEENVVGLPIGDASWRFAHFSLDDYYKIAKIITDGTVTVNSNVKSRPKVKNLKVSYEK